MGEVAFGRYRLIEVIGQGGMGTVYRAHDTKLRRDVAIKVLPPELAAEPGYEERFRREAYTAARLSEPHIIPIHEADEIDGRLFLVMPIVEGTDVQTLLRRDGPITPDRAVHVIEQLAAALDAAHAAGLVHRDVKPSNVLITAKDFVYLIDFGIALDASATKLTSTGTTVGTWAYMAPERFTSGVADKSGDIYSLACVLYECLTANQPFPGDNLPQQMRAHIYQDPPPPSTQQPSIPMGFDTVIARGMTKEPAARFQSAGQLARAASEALAPYEAHTALAPPRKPHLTTRQFSKQWPNPSGASYTLYKEDPPEPQIPSRVNRFGRGPIMLGIAAAALLIAALGVFWMAFYPNPSPPSPTHTTPPTPPTISPASLTGKWSGPVSGDQSGFDVVANIVDGTSLTATVSYPQLNCGGTWTQRGAAGNGVRFVTERITYGSCVTSEVTLAPQDDGTLYFTSTYYAASEQRIFNTLATLRRSTNG